MKATYANYERCGMDTRMFCTKCAFSKDDSEYDSDPLDPDWNSPEEVKAYQEHVHKCPRCGSEKVLGYIVKVFLPIPRVLCVIHDQGDWISTWLVEIEPDADPLKAIHEELFKDDEDWDSLKDSIEWFDLDPLAALVLKDIEWPETCRDDQTFEHNTVKAALYRASKLQLEGEEESSKSRWLYTYGSYGNRIED